MLMFRRVLSLARTSLQSTITRRDAPVRFISSSHTCFVKNVTEENTNEIEIHDDKDRREVVPVEVSINYMLSKAYKETYGDNPVWKLYRRNHKGQIPPKKTRKTCIRGGIISTGNPCPICRDKYLVFDYRNIKLLNQFVSEYTGEVLSYKKTGICQRKHKQLLVAVHQAINFGTLTLDVPLREYNYSEWYSEQKEA